MLKFHLDKILNFHEAAKQGSILNAARVLGISQPALTKSLQILEQSLGEKLYLRHSRGIQLTEAGKILFCYSEKLSHEIPDLEVRIKSRSPMSGILNVGSYETLGISFWPKALKQLKKAHPELRVQITTENSIDLWKRLDEGVLQLIVDAEPPLREKYFSKVLYTDRFGLFVSPTFVAPEGPLPISYVQRAYDRDGKTIREHLNLRKIETLLLYDFDSFVAAKAVSLEGLAAAVLPLSFAEPELQKKKLVPLKIANQEVSFGKHRLCVTCLEENRQDLRISTVLKSLKGSI